MKITINHTANEDSMYGSDGPTPQTDVDESAIKFEELVEAEILRQYPGSEVTFVEGNGMGTEVEFDDDSDDDNSGEEEHILWGIYHKVWEAWDWVVSK